MRVYLSCPVVLYGSDVVEECVGVVCGEFGGVRVVDPSRFGFRHVSMDFFYLLIDSCDVVVYVPLCGFVTAGVFDEVRYALERGKRVYRFFGGRLYLVRGLGDVRECVLDVRLTRMLYRALGVVDRYILELELDRICRCCCDRARALEIFVECYLDRYVSRDVRLKAERRWLHWWMDERDAQVDVDLDVFRRVVDERMREVGVDNLFALCRRSGLSRSMWSRCYFIYSGRTRSPRIGTLVRICDGLGISYLEFEKRDLFMGKYPYDLSNSALWKVAVHVINEGHLNRGINRVEYANNDPVLHFYFKRAVEETGGVFYKPELSMGRIFKSYADGFTMRRLNAIGLQYGRKVLHQPNIDLSVLSDKLWRYYVSTTLTEDGCANLSLNSRSNTLRFYVAWSRSIDITKYVPKDFISVLDRGKSYKLSDIWEIDRNIFDVIYRNPPALLLNEFTNIVQRHAKDPKYYVDPSSWPRPRPSYVHFSKSGNLTVSWEFRVQSSQLVRIFHDKYGMLKGTWKHNVFEKYYDFYMNHLGRRLNDHDLEKYYDLKEKYPYKIDRKWMFNKYKELFGELK